MNYREKLKVLEQFGKVYFIAGRWVKTGAIMGYTYTLVMGEVATYGWGPSRKQAMDDLYSRAMLVMQEYCELAERRSNRR